MTSGADNGCVRSVFNFTVTSLLVLLVASCTSITPAPQTAISFEGPTEIFQQASFQRCELESFVAQDAARQAILYHETETQLLAGPYVGPYQITMYHELFVRIRSQGLRDYTGFGAEYFLACSRRESVAADQGVQQVTACLSRRNILLFLRDGMLSGESESEANTAVKNRLASRMLYPETLIDLIDKLTPRVYSAPDQDAFFKLGRSVFESCLRK